MGPGGLIPRPPPIQTYQVKRSTALRFTTNAAVSQQITWQNLLDTILFTTSAIAPYDLFFAARIRRIRAWGMPVIGQSSSISIIFDNTSTGEVGDRDVHQDSSMGVEPAYLSVSPKKDSLASKFQISTGNTAFFIEAPVGTVIDIHMEFQSDVLGNAQAAANASVAATVGIIAFRGLDGLAVATTKFLVPTSFIQV